MKAGKEEGIKYSMTTLKNCFRRHYGTLDVMVSKDLSTDI
jgi:hypothetical protein